MKTDALILGGGASGLIAAGALARAGRRVLVLEKNPRVGKKLLATGNGRCNFTNLRASATDYFGARALAEPALCAFPPEAVAAYFETLGINLRADAEGRAYPMSNQASSVLDALRLSLSEAGGEVWTDFRAVRIEPDLLVSAEDGRRARGKCLLVATGGQAAPKLGGCADGYALLEPLGHRATRRFCALAPLRTTPIPALKGIRVQCAISLIADGRAIRTETGEILFTDYGVSGIAAMQLARFVRSGMALSICLVDAPGRAFVQDRMRHLPGRPMEDFLNGAVPRRVGQALIRAAGIAPSRPASSLTGAEAAKLGALLNDWRLPVSGAMDFEHAQVTAGGLDARDFDPRSLESLRVPNLFAAGEALDVDGPCGGYNLQWAWASGLLAAKSMLERLES